jgi:hypothetical protein
MVEVTSDMVVPNDIDTLTWSVTIGDAGAPFQSGTVDLNSSTLPATLAIVSGPETPASVTVQVEGLHAGTLRVHREAQLSNVPTEPGEVKQLVMPLNWLCTHDANPSLSCVGGQTCQAGACVTDAIDVSNLPAYSAPDGTCFNVKACFPPAITQTGILAGSGGPGACTISTETLDGLGGDVNVALIVTTSQIGNYGACGIEGSCLIPLAHGAPEGWTMLTDDAGATFISLPPAVCTDQGSTLGGLLVAPATSSCPSKLLESSTCPQDACIQPSGVCPADWGSGWAGYTCSGSASPPPPTLWCSAPPVSVDAGADTEEGGGANGRWCCTVGTTERPPDSDPLLIDDMTGGPQIKIVPPAGDTAGTWYSNAGDPNAPLLPSPYGLFTYTPVPIPLPDGGPMNAACFQTTEVFRTNATNSYVLEGFNFAYPKGAVSSSTGAAGVPIDVSQYTGIRFLAWSRSAETPISVLFPDVNTAGNDPTATCNLNLMNNPDAGACYSEFGSNFELEQAGVWQEFRVTWKELTQNPYFGATFDGLAEQGVFGVSFEVTGDEVASNNPDGGLNYQILPFEFCVSQIYFTIDEPGADGGVDASGDATTDGGVDAE